MHRLLKTHKPGVTSLLVVLALGMFMIVIVSGIAALSLREQQQTRNTEFSNRALQTAEAGVKVAVQKLTADPNYVKTGCAPGADYQNIIQDTLLNQEITCIEVQNTFKSYEGFNEQDKATQLIIETPSATTGVNSVQLRWHSKTLDQPTIQPFALPTSGPFYPETNNYNFAASVEMTFIFWPRGNFVPNAEGIRTATIFFTPGNDDKSQPSNGVNSKCEGQGNIKNLGEYRCVTNDTSDVGFNLTQALRLSGGDSAINYNYAIRIKPRYKDTHFQFTAFDSNGNPIDAKSTKAQIDVTARTGDLYRRIKAEKVIAPSALESLFDSVLYAGNSVNDSASRDICKNFIVKSDNSLAPASSPVCSN